MGRRYGNGDYENRPLHTYLGRSAEEMLEELKKADAQPDREHECLRTALGVGCRALTRFSHAFEDEEFLAGLERVEKNREDDRYLQFLHDIDLFEDFLEADQAVLKTDGAVGKDAANALFKRARLLINEIRENAYSELRHELPETVAQLEDLTCGRAEQLRREYAEQAEAVRGPEKNRHRRRFVRRVAYAVGGAAILSGNVAIDAGIIGGSFGLIPVPIATALSSTVGTTLIGNGLTAG